MAEKRESRKAKEADAKNARKYNKSEKHKEAEAKGMRDRKKK